MRDPLLHRFALDERRYVIDPETSFCFECDEVSWDVIELYPYTPMSRIVHLLKDKHPVKEVEEVVGELEWLRQTKAILPGRSVEEIKKQFDLESGCRALNLKLGSVKQLQEPWVQQVFPLLLGRSEKQSRLEFTIELPDTAGLVNAEIYFKLATQLAKLSEKELSLILRFPVSGKKIGISQQLHIAFCFAQDADTKQVLETLAKANLDNLSKLGKLLDNPLFPTESKVELIVLGSDVLGDVQALEKAGIKHIHLNLSQVFLEGTSAEPEEIFCGMEKLMAYYAQQLQKNKNLRIEPLARMFWRIYNGTGLRRSDPAGTNALAIDNDGSVYPSADYRMLKQYALGNLNDGYFDKALLKRFEDLGVTTTPACMQCWSRNLCGGGNAAVNERMSNAWNTPHEAWCDAQRAFIARSVAVFNVLNHSGVNFNRIYGGLRPEKQRLGGLMKLAWATLRMQISLRSLEEADAPLLKRWEDWNDASYFTLHERSVLTTTVYDREMDALHPRGLAQEFVLTQKNGTPMGLLRVQASTLPDTVQIAVYFARSEDYNSDAIRKSMKFILGEATKNQAFRHVLVSVGESESALRQFLAALEFEAVGVQRDALYLHDKYHDVHCYHLQMAQ